MSLDWTKCVICQEATKEVLKCPLNSHGPPEDTHQTYLAFLQNVNSFREANVLPIELKFGNDVDVECLYLNHGCWHKSCHLKFSHSKLKKAQERADRKRSEDSRADEEERPTAKCRKRQSVSEERLKCIFCKGGDSDKLHCFSVMETDKSIRRMALELKDFELLGRMSEGDLIAIEAKYHLKCLISVKNRHRSLCAQKAQDLSDTCDDEKMDKSIAFVELIEYIEQSIEKGSHMFKLSELASLYTQRLVDIGINQTINKTRLKNTLLEYFKDTLQEQTDGRNTVLVFRDAIIDRCFETTQLFRCQNSSEGCNNCKERHFCSQRISFFGVLSNGLPIKIFTV